MTRVKFFFSIDYMIGVWLKGHIDYRKGVEERP